MDVDEITQRVSGKCVSHLTVTEDGRLAVHFVDGSTLLVERSRRGLAIGLASDDKSRECSAAAEPTTRQSEYLEFIKKYMVRFGISPAESDIQRHFLVSAPSVNQMMQLLERLGFITRRRGTPRSIGIVGPADCVACGGSHHLKNPNFERPNKALEPPEYLPR